jgi:hypothetical protein
MVRTTPPKEAKAGTSSTEAPIVQALVTRPRSKTPDDNLADDDLDLLNFDATESKIVYWTNSQLQMCWPDSEKSDCLI